MKRRNYRFMVSFLRKLHELEKQNPRLIIAPLSSHPAVTDRIANASQWLARSGN